MVTFDLIITFSQIMLFLPRVAPCSITDGLLILFDLLCKLDFLAGFPTTDVLAGAFLLTAQLQL